MWHLKKYARFVEKTDSTSVETKGTWEYFDNTKSPLELTIGERGHLLINHGSTIMESYNLSMAQQFLRGQCKGDSMIIFYHMQSVSHRFRVKFSDTESKTSDEACQGCAEQLAKYFSIKTISKSPEINSQQEDSTEKAILQGEVTLGTVADVLTKTGCNQLPTLYRNTNAFQQEDISMLLKLCLSDPNFPAFVEQVESELNQLKSTVDM